MRRRKAQDLVNKTRRYWQGLYRTFQQHEARWPQSSLWAQKRRQAEQKLGALDQRRGLGDSPPERVPFVNVDLRFRDSDPYQF